MKIEIRTEFVLYWIEGDELLVCSTINNQISVGQDSSSKLPNPGVGIYFSELGTFIYIGSF